MTVTAICRSFPDSADDVVVAAVAAAAAAVAAAVCVLKSVVFSLINKPITKGCTTLPEVVAYVLHQAPRDCV